MTIRKKTVRIIAEKTPSLHNNEKGGLAISPAIHNIPDITRSMRDEEYISYLAAIVESSHDAIISKTLNGIIKTWNKGSEKMFGYTAEQAIGKHISIIIPPEYIDEEKKIVEKILNNQCIDHYETVRNKKNGVQFYVSLTVSPLKDQAGNIIGISKIARDVSSRKHSEAALINSNKELAFENDEKEKRAAELVIANIELAFQNVEKEKRADELVIAIRHLRISEEQIIEANKKLESFCFLVSHDLRAPLRAINGYTKMLKANFETQLDPEAHRLMNNIVRNVKKMGQLIDDLVNFSRIGRRELVKMNVPMHDIVTGICNELKNEQADRNIVFNIKKIFPALADNMAVKQVWLNLVSNAIKYSKLKDTAIIEIGSEKKGNEIIYYIKDNGAGFDMRYADKLFGVFQRLHSNDVFEGTGVGLALVQQIISKHGGKVWAEGRVNEGATFFFSLHK